MAKAKNQSSQLSFYCCLFFIVYIWYFLQAIYFYGYILLSYIWPVYKDMYIQYLTIKTYISKNKEGMGFHAMRKSRLDSPQYYKHEKW